MNYQVLYRKYRPNNFDNIVGQDYIINILKKSILNNKISHAYLFCGPRGTGKTSTARVFAKAINCKEINQSIPCNNCDNCKIFDYSSDIIEIDAASNNGVDEIRELKNNVKLVPADFKHKVYIIDEVHMLSSGAFNALLKTLEEPPNHVIFILATTEAQKLPITVISRCQKFDFHKISPSIIENKLIEICTSEKIIVDPEVLEEIAILSDGSVRDALGMLEMITGVNEKVTISKFEELISVISYKKLEKLYSFIDNNDINKISDFFENLEIKNIDFSSFVNKFIIILKKKAVLIKQRSLNSQITFEKLKELIFNLNKILFENRTSVSPFLLAEIEILSILKTENPIENDENYYDNRSVEIKNNIFSESKKDMEVNSEKIVTNKNQNFVEIDKKTNIRINNCFVNANKESLSKYKKLWKQFEANLIEIQSKYLQYIMDSECVAASESHLIILVNSESQSVLFNNNCVKIEKTFFKEVNQKILLISIFKNQWDSCKKDYICNKKEGKEYKYIEEEKEKLNAVAKGKVKSVALEIFDKKVVKIK